jgi:hypothetical protein
MIPIVDWYCNKTIQHFIECSMMFCEALKSNIYCGCWPCSILLLSLLYNIISHSKKCYNYILFHPRQFHEIYPKLERTLWTYSFLSWSHWYLLLARYIFNRVATKSNSAYNMMNVVRASTFSFPHNILRMKCLI